MHVKRESKSCKPIAIFSDMKRKSRNPQSGNQLGRPLQKLVYFSNVLLGTFKILAFSNIFEKWTKSEEKRNFGGRWVWVPLYSPPPPNQNFVAAPLEMGARKNDLGRWLIGR